jgi:ABC-2 type transport system ATP-binding protein
MFNGFAAVRGVSMQLQPGMLVGLIGPNGAGKTTLMRAIACLQRSMGTVRLFGEPLRLGATELLRHIGFTPDNPPIYEEMTVRQFLQFIARGYDLSGSEIDERIEFWLERVWLSEKADQKIKTLSRGMRQRIGIARTLLANPSVILLDEPAAGLDPAGRVQFRQLLVSLREQGKALIVSSHILSDMSEYCTHIGIMSGGRMVRFGTVAEIASDADTSLARYTIGLAHAVAGVERALEAISDLRIVEIGDDQIIVEYAASRDSAAALLAALIAARLPVASFIANVPDLEEAYLRTGIRQVD